MHIVRARASSGSPHSIRATSRRRATLASRRQSLTKSSTSSPSFGALLYQTPTARRTLLLEHNVVGNDDKPLDAPIVRGTGAMGMTEGNTA